MYKPACRIAQQQIQYNEAQSMNKAFNFVLNILFLLILIFISVKQKTLTQVHNRVKKTTAILVFYLILGSLTSSGFIKFPWRALVFTRISTGLIVCASTLLTFMIICIFEHIYR